MDTNRIKRFATEARNILKAGIAAKITSLGFDRKGDVAEEHKPQLMQGATLWNGQLMPETFYNQWMSLYDRIQHKGVNEVYEEAAYTWFNRLCAIRILQKNNLCAPVLDYTDAARTPFIVDEARQGRIPEMSDDMWSRLSELLDDDTKVTEQVAVLINAWCHDNPIISRCFGAMADYTELLLPNNILTEGGFVDMLNHTEFISDDDYTTPELIGWLYQFYIAERKDEVFAKKGKFTADEIPAATQIFTPNWIVKYMVQNTVGRIYLDNNPYETQLPQKWQYLVESSEKPSSDTILKYDELTEFKVADLACGSGHILNECFDLLYDLYIAEGYSRSEAIENIFRYNLTGIDLDTRAKQLATFALLLKACQKDAAFANGHCLPNVMDMPHVDRYTYRDLDGHFCYAYEIKHGTPNASKELDAAFILMEQAENLGSIIKFDICDSTRQLIQEMVDAYEANPQHEDSFEPLIKGYKFILSLTEKYHALVMNPPYMYSSNMPKQLLKYVNSNYDEGRTDLCVAFMRVAQRLLKDYGKYGMINMQSWMFLTSFSKLRNDILTQMHIDNLLHLGPHTFDELNGEVVQNVAFVVTLKKSEELSKCYRLIGGSSTLEKERMFLSNINNYFSLRQSELTDIPGNPLAYWVTPSILNAFRTEKSMNEVSYARVGMFTGDNSRFLKEWWEVNNHDVECHILDNQSSIDCGKKWFGYNKGGGYRKWYGNLDLVVNYFNGGYEIFELAKEEKRNCQNYPSEYKFRDGITWTGMSSDKISFRYLPEGCLFDSNKGPVIFSVQEGVNLSYLIAFLNTKVCNRIANVLNPTLSKQINDILNFPIAINDDKQREIQDIGNNCVEISRKDWDSHETSWDFSTNPLVEESIILPKTETVFNDSLEQDLGLLFPEFVRCDAHLEERQVEKELNPNLILDCVLSFQNKWTSLFRTLYENEVEINRQFIKIYKLEDEIDFDVPLDEITILQQGEATLDGDDVDGTVLCWHHDVLMKQLISYMVGCWMGRYRLDRPGLHIAHPEPTAEELASYQYGPDGETFVIDDDAIIPILPKDSPFEDNLANRIDDFVRITFGRKNLAENLNFIERSLGKSIKDYVQKDFWKDHKKMYQNRPIYWLFASKKGTFQCIAYMHRMNAYTVERIRAKYLLPYIETLQTRIADLDARRSELTTRESKQLLQLTKTLDECQEYHERLQVVAEKAISFDLDDGVVMNYAKFGDVVQKIK